MLSGELTSTTTKYTIIRLCFKFHLTSINSQCKQLINKTILTHIRRCPRESRVECSWPAIKLFKVFNYFCRCFRVSTQKSVFRSFFTSSNVILMFEILRKVYGLRLTILYCLHRLHGSSEVLPRFSCSIRSDICRVLTTLH